MTLRRALAAMAAVMVMVPGVPAAAANTAAADTGTEHRTDRTDRFATFNASLNRSEEGLLRADLSAPDDEQAQAIAEIIQRNRPDVLLINEFDFDEDGESARLFQENYLSVAQGGTRPIDYPYRFSAPSNTGIPSGFDLDRNGEVGTTPGEPGYSEDALGFGQFPGQFGMVVYSRYPIDTRGARTFQMFRWKDMPGAVLPDDPDTPEKGDWYSPEALQVFRLSSKSHWDLPVRIGRRTVHFLVSHPTPPSFDGEEKRNARRNHDEIRFWADYVHPRRGRYIYDDRGRRGGLHPRARFVIAGDQNADPHDGDSFQGAIDQLLRHPAINSRQTPVSAGAVEASETQGGANDSHKGDPAADTADFNDDPAPGNLRVDYVLPSRRMRALGSGVFWPASDDPLSRLAGSSDHRLVWVDVRR